MPIPKWPPRKMCLYIFPSNSRPTETFNNFPKGVKFHPHMATGHNHVPRGHVPMLSDPEGLDRTLDPEGLER